MATTKNSPSDEDREDLLLSCRYGDLEDVQAFAEKFGKETMASVRDENENCVLHMVCANGHDDILKFLLPLVPLFLLSHKNSAGSTPLHWAALNRHLSTCQLLVNFKRDDEAVAGQEESKSGAVAVDRTTTAVAGADLIDIKNTAGHTPLDEAELAEWQEGALWLVKVMNLEPQSSEQPKDSTGDEDVEAEAEGGDEDENVTGEVDGRDIEVEIQDADGGIAKMRISEKDVSR